MSQQREETFAAIDDQLANLEGQIVQIHVRMRALRARRNALSPFCRLPPDILYHILKLLVQSEHVINQRELRPHLVVKVIGLVSLVYAGISALWPSLHPFYGRQST
jgi:hypothetical protein